MTAEPGGRLTPRALSNRAYLALQQTPRSFGWLSAALRASLDAAQLSLGVTLIVAAASHSVLTCEAS